MGTLLESYIESVCAALVLTGIPVSRLEGTGGKWHLLALLLLEKSSKDPAPSNTCSEISKPISLLYIPLAFFRLLILCCSSSGLFVVLSLEGQGLPFLLTLPDDF